MKNIGLSWLLLLALAGSVSAQVSVDVVMDQDQFLPNAAMPVKVRIANSSGQTLRFGDETWITYSIEAKNGFVVMKNGNAPEAHNFQVKAAEVATARADLAPYFDISQPGRYAVTATVKIKDWDIEVSSPPKYFDVVHGVKIWEQDFGLPQSPDDHSQPEVRKYILQQASFARRTELFLRLTDATGTKTLRVLPIGPMISFSDPQTAVDQHSDLHVLYQKGAHIYNYSVVNPDGELTTRQTYSYTGSAPRLRVDDAGIVKIVGGMRHLADNDFPSNHKSASYNDLLPPPSAH